MLLGLVLAGAPLLAQAEWKLRPDGGLPSSAAPAEPLIHDGDRVVFLGDSITVLHTWTRYVEAYVRLRHPEWKVTFINAGVGGNTVSDALARLDTDVIAQKPTVVFVNFGMNDASFPQGSPGWAFEQNSTTLFERLLSARWSLEGDGGVTGKVRSVVWVDPTPYDSWAGPMVQFNKKRVTRLEELVSYVHKTGAEKHVTVVGAYDAVARALAGWRAANRPENLMPDRIHPGTPLHAVMAAEVLKAIGFEVSATVAQATFSEGTLRVEGSLDELPWNGETKISFDVPKATPIPLVTADDATWLDSKELASLRRLVLKVKGLQPTKRYRVRAGLVDVGRFSGAELASGVEVMANAAVRATPSGDRPSLAECSATAGNPWVNDFFCVFDLLYEKDQLRMSMRHEKTRALPDFVPGMLERYFALQREWVEAVDRDIEARARALRAGRHEVTLEPVP